MKTENERILVVLDNITNQLLNSISDLQLLYKITNNLDSQEYLMLQDELNRLSLDDDRDDTYFIDNDEKQTYYIK